MSTKKGKLIVIEGLDGTGKSTQFRITVDKLTEAGENIKGISFPDYKKQSSALIKMYLNGEFGNKPEDVNAYAASSFYAVDRYASFKKYWQQEYLTGSVILCDRYTTSNAIHQMSKINKENWDEYLTWLEDYEYKKLELPEPCLVIYLNMPDKISSELLSKRYKGDESKKDLHEKDLEYMKKCRESAEYAGKRWNWKIINCANESGLLPIEDINKKILKQIEEVISLI